MADAWEAEARELRELAKRNAARPDVAANLLRYAEMAEASAAWWRAGQP